MNILHSRRLKERAASILSQTQPDYRKLVALHAAVSFGVMLAVSLIQLLLTMSMGNESGLSGMNSSAIFSTVKVTLGLFTSLLLPFWEVGILHTSIRVVRREDAEFTHLTRGLRRWGVVLRYYLLLLLIYMAAAILMTNLIPIFTYWIPIPQSMYDAVENMDIAALTDGAALLEMLPQDAIIGYILPVVAITTVVFSIILLWLSYRFRMSLYLLMDDPQCPALPSLLLSNQMLKGHKWSLFKLDLSFWWYYVLQIGISAISFGPELLGLAGVTLNISSDVQALLFQGLYSLAGIGLAWFFGAYVQTTYACVYDQLRNPNQD